VASKQYQIIVSAVGKGIKATTKSITDGFTRGQKAVAAFNATTQKTRQASDRLTAGIKGLIAAYAGWQSVVGAVRIIEEADQAAFNMASSVRAANREFDNTGSIEDWDAAVSRLSDRLQVYSDTALKNAISRTVDMTKRLGLEKDQMEELIVRAGDLGAGKVDLEGAIERVSAAMRGEAESAEYLGLTLNENYIKAWYEANAATEKAWKDLSDVEKAQARYAVFLEQTNEMQGRAADSAKTLGGAWNLAKKEVVNAVSTNADATAAMNQLANSLRENAGEIGDIVARLVTLGAKAAEFAVEWRNVILAVVGTTVAVSVISKLVITVKALNAAFVFLTGTKISLWISWLVPMFQELAVVIGASTVAVGALSAVAAAALAAISYDLYLVYQGWTMNRDAAKKLAEQIDQVKDKYKKFRYVRIPGNITEMAQKDLDKLNDKLFKARAYWQVTIQELRRKSQEKSSLGVFTDEAREAQKELKSAILRLAEINAAIDNIADNHGLEKPAEAVAATTEQLEAFKKSAEDAYQAAQKQAEDYAAKIRELNESIADREISLQDKIRELRRKNMEEARATRDLRAQALEKEAAAQKAVNEFAVTGSERQLELAQRFAKDAESAWSRYADTGENATDAAIKGLERVNQILDQADQIQIDTFSKMRDDAEKAMADIEAMIKHIEESVELNIPVALKNLQQVQDQINRLIRDETKWITIKTREGRAAGGRAGMARGGRFPGNSKVDSIPVLARPGEGFVRNEALAVWDRNFGKGFFEAINAPWSKAGQAIIARLSGGLGFNIPNLAPPPPKTAFATGGRVGGAAPANMGTLTINVGGGSFPVSAPVDVLADLKNSLARENALRSND